LPPSVSRLSRQRGILNIGLHGLSRGQLCFYFFFNIIDEVKYVINTTAEMYTAVWIVRTSCHNGIALDSLSRCVGFLSRVSSPPGRFWDSASGTALLPPSRPFLFIDHCAIPCCLKQSEIPHRFVILSAASSAVK
jgi:hypothetical protein